MASCNAAECEHAYGQGMSAFMCGERVEVQMLADGLDHFLETPVSKRSSTYVFNSTEGANTSYRLYLNSFPVKKSLANLSN